jgi:ribose/xylose/arabinose/galactoside ABC-type transport system permease subunit
VELMEGQASVKPRRSVGSSIGGFFRGILRARESGIAIPLILLIAVVSIVNPVFLDIDNLLNIARQISFTFIVGVAMTFVLIAAGLDLSVGSVLALGGVICGLVLRASMLAMPLWIAIAIAIVIGALIGVVTGIFNGVVITRFKIPALIVTLGMMYIARGVVQVLTRGNPVYPFPDQFNEIGQGYLLGVPNVVYVAVVLGILSHITLTQTAFGRAVFAVGGNTETARLSGINVPRVLTSVYVICGIAAAITGVLTASRLASALANAGTGMELQVIAACIIGGTSMFGGSGSILGTLIGASFMSIIANGMVLMKISVYYQAIVIGSIIILAVGIDQFRRRRGGMLGG